MYSEFPHILIYNITTPATTSDFQVSLSLPRVAPIATNYSNIRFSDGVNKLPYWVQTDFTSTSATVWVKLKEPNTTRLYCYYGGPAISESNGDNTFLFFDNFDGSSLNTNKWEYKWYTGSGGYAATVVNGYIEIWNGTSTYSAIGGKTLFPMPLISNCRWRYAYGGSGSSSSDLLLFTQVAGGEDSNWLRINYTYTNTFLYEKRISGTIYTYQSFSRTIPSSFVNTFTRITTSSYKYFESGSQVNTVTTQDRYTSGSLVPMVGTWYNATIQVDWLFIRKHADPEPTVTLAGYTVNPDSFIKNMYIHKRLNLQQGNKFIRLDWGPWNVP